MYLILSAFSTNTFFVYTSFQSFFFSFERKMYTFIQQDCITLIKCYNKYIYNVTKILNYLKNCEKCHQKNKLHFDFQNYKKK